MYDALGAIVRFLDPMIEVRRYQSRCKNLRGQAIRRQDWPRAKRYDRDVQDLDRYIRGEIKIFPTRKNREKKLYVPSEGRDFAKLPGYGLPYGQGRGKAAS